MLLKDFGRQVKKCRILSGLSQTQFAKKMMWSRTTLYNLEHNISKPSVANFVAIDDLLVKYGITAQKPVEREGKIYIDVTGATSEHIDSFVRQIANDRLRTSTDGLAGDEK